MLERHTENLLYASRWLLAPIYLGLSPGLVMLGIKFFQEAVHTFVLSALGMAYVDKMNQH